MKGLSFILFSTFLVGMATGVFAYFMSGLNEPLIDFGGNELTRGFEVIADAYGGCQMGGACPSYRIDETGKYIFIIRHREGEDERIEGKLSAAELRNLKSKLENADLAQVETSSFAGTCPASFDGAAYTFDIRIGETRSRIDTCEHDTEGLPLFELLEGYFGTFSRS